MNEIAEVGRGKQAKLKLIIARLHRGEKVAEVKRDFSRLIEGVSAQEIGAMEQSLVDEGLPVEEIQRLCEVHVDVFKSSMIDSGKKGRREANMPGHPVHTMLAENREARRRIQNLLSKARAYAWGTSDAAGAREALNDLSALVIHYQRKENQLFPWLEKAGFTGPSKVMWGKDDEIRAQLKATSAILEGNSGDARRFRTEVRKLAGMMRRMFFMEERILIPNALSRLSEKEWALVRKGEDAIGWSWTKPGALYDADLVLAESHDTPKLSELIANAKPGAYDREPAKSTTAGATEERAKAIPLDTGALPADLLNLVLKKLPVDISVVDENDKVLYYSDNPDRIFPRSPGVIGRDVRNCHPDKSLAIVQRILDDFRKGNRDSARFWIQMAGKFIVIDYLALRDERGNFRGTLEMTQDATKLRGLQGQKRLLDQDS